MFIYTYVWWHINESGGCLSNGSDDELELELAIIYYIQYSTKYSYETYQTNAAGAPLLK